MKFKYDTIHLWIDKAYLSEKYDEEVSIKLTNRECSVNEKNEMKYSGYVRNMRITIKSTAVYIRGSIGKYANGDSTENALVTLCEYLQIPLEHAKVVRLHVALDLILDYPVKLYFKSLGHCKKYERFPFSKSVYYTNATSVLAFYNKIAE